MEPGRERLVRQRVDGERGATPAETVRWMGALQAQDHHQALWAVGVRTRDATRTDVERALAAGEIVKTWPMRGTIHLVPPEDARWMVALSEPRMVRADAGRRRQLEIDDRTLGRAVELFHGAFGGGRVLTRADAMAVLEGAGIPTGGQRGYHLLWYAAQTGVICFGPAKDTFVLLAEWAPHQRALSREESLAELATRYRRSHAPATERDFAWWAGLTLTDARTAYALSTEPEPVEPAPTAVHLLPGFDEFLLGYTDRTAVLDPVDAPKVCPGGNGVFFPMIVSGGRIVGTWKRDIRTEEVTPTPFGDLDVPTSAIARYRTFAGAAPGPPP